LQEPASTARIDKLGPAVAGSAIEGEREFVDAVSLAMADAR